jgi:hypothetical protein
MPTIQVKMFLSVDRDESESME